MFEVAIAGAGPAGATAAYLLAKVGITCLLLDKASFPRQKPCGGALSGRILDLFPHIQPYVECKHVEAILHYKTPKEDIKLYDEKGLVFYIRRLQFDNDLLNLAKNENVEVRENTRVTNIEQFAHHITIHCSKGEKFDSKFLIGADGVHSVIRKRSGLQLYWHGENNVLGYENEVEVPQEILDQYYTKKRTTHMHLGLGELYGYGWIFPKKNHLNIGFGESLIRMTPSQILHSYQAYIEFCQKNNLLPELFSISSRPMAWQLYSNGPIKHFCKGRVLLAGDAAGFVHPFSGEGILYALWSGKIAAECLGKVLSNQLSVAEFNDEYEKRCMREFGLELKKALVLNKWGKKTLGSVFQFARFDPLISTILVKVFNGSEKIDVVKRQLIWRVLIGALKGHYWKK